MPQSDARPDHGCGVVVAMPECAISSGRVMPGSRPIDELRTDDLMMTTRTSSVSVAEEVCVDRHLGPLLGRQQTLFGLRQL